MNDAESLLQKLQQTLCDGANLLNSSDRDALRDAERAHGAQATRYGRLLNELTEGSVAWDLWEKAGRARLPRVHELCLCEPLLRTMRESGELAERERLLKQRDAALADLWQQASATNEELRQGAETLYDEYFAAVAQVTESYQAHYSRIRQAARGMTLPLTGPRIRSRPFLQPPILALLFRACHGTGQEFSQARNAIRAAPADAVILDPLAWDIAALAVSAFFVRTDGTRSDAAFPFLVDDYFQWRGVDPRKRSPEMRQKIAARLELLCSDRLTICSQTTLWQTDPATRQRKKTPLLAEGPFLVKHAHFSRSLPDSSSEAPTAAGYLLSLGGWASLLVEERAMRGIHLKRLAEYDLQRQQWERRIGWYLVFQMNNQGSRMTFEDVVKDGKSGTVVTPQHPLKMKTVLAGSHVPWEETARTNPGKVIKQWNDALKTLQNDGILGSCVCLDGLPDGSDLPTRGRLAGMLERRTRFVPGKEMLPHLRAKQSAAAQNRGR